MADTLDLRCMRCGECGQRFGADATFCPFDGAKLESKVFDASADPLIGKVIDGRYQVTGVLGEGGMGIVYKVRHTSLDRSFAMKVLRRDLARDPDLAARFLREARATASVKHPNLVAISDFGQIEADLPYFVMELLAGNTLAHTIKTGGAIPSALAVRIIVKIASAIGAAHDAKIVHRDLKPDNVFLLGSAVGRSGDVDVRVVDFGASMILGASRVTKTGIVFGTPHYMSPEQASGQPVDHRADVYALGVMMYEMFAGRVPFVADTYMGVLTQHMFVQPVPPSLVCVGERARELGALEDVILRALEKKPEQRYATMQELADDIERVTSFAPDGALRVVPSMGRAREPSRPVFAMANELEAPSREEMNAAAIVTGTTTRRRRDRARAWVVYLGIAIGVAAVTVGVLRLLQPRAEEPRPAGRSIAITNAPAPTAPPTPTPMATPIPTATPGPIGAAAATAGTISTPAPRSARSPRTPPPPPAKKPPPHPSADFPDPWSK